MKFLELTLYQWLPVLGNWTVWSICGYNGIWKSPRITLWKHLLWEDTFFCHPYGVLLWGLFQESVVDCQWYWIPLLQWLCIFFSYFLLNPYFDEFLSHQKQILEITSTCRLIGRVATIRVSPLIGGLMFLCFSYNVVNVHK